MNKYVISVKEEAIAMYVVYGKNKKEAEEYFYSHLAKIQGNMIGYNKEIKEVVCIEKVNDNNFLNVVKCSNANED